MKKNCIKRRENDVYDSEILFEFKIKKMSIHIFIWFISFFHSYMYVTTLFKAQLCCSYILHEHMMTSILLYTSPVCDLASITCVLLMIYWIRDTFCIKNHHFSIVVQKLIWSVPSIAFNFWIAWNNFFFQGITNLQHWPLFFNTLLNIYIHVQRKCITGSTSLKFLQLIICFILIDILLNMRR